MFGQLKKFVMAPGVSGDEGGISYKDPDIRVEWPIPEGMELILSEKDTKWGSFREYAKELGKA